MNSFKINKLFTGRQWQSTIPMHSKNNFLDAKTIPDLNYYLRQVWIYNWLHYNQVVKNTLAINFTTRRISEHLKHQHGLTYNTNV